MVRVLVFLLIFNSFIFSALAFNIDGELPENINNTIMKYHNELGEEGISKLLDINDIKLYYFQNDTLFIKKGLTVKSVVFKGSTFFLKQKLLNIANLYKGNLYNDIILKDSKKNIEEFFKLNGFYKVDVKYSADAGNIIFDINSNNRYFITDLKITNLESSQIDYILKNNLILNENNIERIKDEINIKLSKLGYFDNKIDIEIVDNDKSPVYFDTNNFFQSFLSLFHMQHQGVTLNIYIQKGNKYFVNIINDIDTSIDLLVRDTVYKYLREINIFSIRNLEKKIYLLIKEQYELESNVNIKIEKQIISIEIETNKKIKFEEVLVKYKNLRVNSFIKQTKIVKSNEENFFQSLKDRLKKEGYYDVKLISKKIEKKETILEKISDEIKARNVFKVVNFDFYKQNKKNDTITVFYIDEGEQYRIANNIINNKKYPVKKKYFANKFGINLSKKDLISKIDKEFYFNYLIIDKIVPNDNRTVDIYYKNNIKEYDVIQIIVNNSKIEEVVKNRFFSEDNKLTAKKYTDIRKFLNSQEIILSHRIDIIKLDNKNIILNIHLYYKESNSIYGGISYDSIDKLSFYVGYRKLNIFDSAHDFSILASSSFRETYAGILLSNHNLYFNNFSNSYELITKYRDEDEYTYSTNKLKLKGVYAYNHFIISADIYLESIDTSNEVYEDNILEEIDDRFKNIGNMASITWSNFDDLLNPKNGIALKISTNPVYASKQKDYFIVNDLTYSIYYTFWRNWTTSFRNQISQINGNDEVIPLTYRFTFGGPYRMRAYDYREIGSADTKGNIYGGTKQIYFELNQNYQINEFLSTGLFYEAGQAEENFDLNKLTQDIGIYLGVTTPLGQLKLSLAADTEDMKTNKFYIIFGSSIP